MNQKAWIGIAVGCWLLLALIICVIIPLGLFVAPHVAAQAQAQGMKELPVLWQVTVDLADICNHRWYVVFPLLLIGAVYATARALRK